MTNYKAKDLIREIKARPGIYNKQKLKQPKRENKHKLWLEVTECLTPDNLWQKYSEQDKEAATNEIQLKWKHIRDHFHRDVKLQLCSKSQEKRKYIHFDEMLFMLPFVGYKMKSAKSFKVNSSTSAHIDFNCNDEQTLNNSIQRTLQQLLCETETEPKQANCNRSKATLVDGEIDNNNSELPTDKSRLSLAENAQTNKSPAQPSAQIRDSDIGFCLSLVPSLRKLTESQKLLAKIEILKVLYRIVAKQQATNCISSKTTKTNTIARRNKDLNKSVRNSNEVNDQDPLSINAEESNTVDDMNCDNNESEDPSSVPNISNFESITCQKVKLIQY